MNRRFESDWLMWRRRLNAGHVRTISMFIASFLLFNIIIYISIKYVIHPMKMSYTTESTTIPTTTTTTTELTTLETTTEPPFRLGCFSSATLITLGDGSKKSLSSLNTGDEVRVYSAMGHFQTSRVLSVFHHFHSSMKLLEVYTDDNDDEPIRLTPKHSILIGKQSHSQHSFKFDYASILEIGDSLLSSNLKSLRVSNIKEIMIYNQTVSTPLTFEGNIIANDVIASCYGTYSHTLMHLLSGPVRYWGRMEVLPQLNTVVIHALDLYAKFMAF